MVRLKAWMIMITLLPAQMPPLMYIVEALPPIKRQYKGDSSLGAPTRSAR